MNWTERYRSDSWIFHVLKIEGMHHAEIHVDEHCGQEKLEARFGVENPLMYDYSDGEYSSYQLKYDILMAERDGFNTTVHLTIDQVKSMAIEEALKSINKDIETLTKFRDGILKAKEIQNEQKV